MSDGPNVISMKEALERGDRVQIPVTQVQAPTLEQIAGKVLECHKLEQDMIARRNELKQMLAIYKPPVDVA